MVGQYRPRSSRVEARLGPISSVGPAVRMTRVSPVSGRVGLCRPRRLGGSDRSAGRAGRDLWNEQTAGMICTDAASDDHAGSLSGVGEDPIAAEPQGGQ